MRNGNYFCESFVNKGGIMGKRRNEIILNGWALHEGNGGDEILQLVRLGHHSHQPEGGKQYTPPQTLDRPRRVQEYTTHLHQTLDRSKRMGEYTTHLHT